MITALCGGVGGAKLALGLDRCGVDLALIVNTGDDFLHYGLPICPDLDTVAYTLSGKVDESQGWGRGEESFAVKTELEALGETPWFQLGDRDIALHLLRARLLEEVSLTEATARIAARLGVRPRLLPMCNSAAPTILETADGPLPFQDYFVRLRCAPTVAGLKFGGEGLPPAPEALAALTAPALRGILICPSNPLLSIAPILAIAPLRDALAGRKVPAVAVSPVIAGQAVKGPTAKLFRELGLGVDAVAVARLYAGLVDHFVLDEADAALAPEIEALGMKAPVTRTLMMDVEDKERLARFCLSLLAG
jgi:LPPG:FO 2-phospho-L-lactate transferase